MPVRSNGLMTSDSIFNASADTLERKVSRVLDVVESIQACMTARFEAIEAKIEALQTNRSDGVRHAPSRVQTPNGRVVLNDNDDGFVNGWQSDSSAEGRDAGHKSAVSGDIPGIHEDSPPPNTNVEVHATSTLARRRSAPSRRSPRKRRRVGSDIYFGDENEMLNNDYIANDDSDDDDIPAYGNTHASADNMEDEEILDEGMASIANSPYRLARSRTPSIGSGTPVHPSATQVPMNKNYNVQELDAMVREADDMKAAFFDLQCTFCPMTVLKKYKVLADQCGYALAMLRVAEMYLQGAISLAPKGKRVIRNTTLAGRYAKKVLEHESVKNLDDEDDDSPYWGIKSRALAFQGESLMVRSNKKDKAQALTNFKTSAAMRDEYGQYRVGWYYMEMYRNAQTERTEKSYLADCMTALEKAVEMGSGDAAALLASIYENVGELDTYITAINEHNQQELNEDQRAMRAKELFWQSMDLGCSGGTNDVAVCFEVGYADVEPNFHMALDLYKRAFSLGWVAAASNIALLYQVGGCDERFKDKIDVKEALQWHEVGHRVRCPLSTNHLANAYDIGGIAKLDRKKACEYYELALKYGNESNDYADVVEQAKEHLCKLLCASVLMDEINPNEAKKKMKKFAKDIGVGRLEKAKSSTMWIVCSSLGPALYGDCHSAKIAPKTLQNALGDENMKVVQQYVSALCIDFQNGRHLDENRRKLCAIVDEPKIQSDLNLLNT